jgi:deferrochelatase/peroxidase EfeB
MGTGAAANSASPAGGTQLDLPDIQGLLLHGYKGYDFIRHLIFRIDDAAGVQALCKALAPGGGGPLSITESTQWASVRDKPPYRLNIAVTKTGLAKLVTDARYSAIAARSNTLVNAFGQGAVARGSKVGDFTGSTNDPKNWWRTDGWQLPAPPDLAGDFDFILSLYAQNPAGRESWCATLLAMIPAGAAVLTFKQDADPLPAGPDFIHFGYHDGISQPRIAGTPPALPGTSAPGAPPGAASSLALAAPGDDPDDRPIVPSWYFIIEDAEETTYNTHPFLVNGSFGAFRLLSQDVGRFEELIARDPDPERLAAKICGRWRDGTPLEVSPEASDPSLTGFDLTNFDYQAPSLHQKGTPPADGDTGQRCPYASHIRRSNPRDDTSVQGNAGVGNAMAVQHRVLRRAQPYGPSYVPGDPADRGLVGYFIGAVLTEQFEFIMGSWITHGGFAGNDHSANSGGFDVLFGPPPLPAPQSPGSEFFYYCEAGGDPGNSADYTKVDGVTQLVTTKGGLYVFFPSLTALALMAEGRIE